MIRLFTLVFLSSFFISGNYAQSGFQDKTKVGFVVGPSLNSLKVKQSNNVFKYAYKENGSFSFGVQLITKFSDKFAFEYGITSNRINSERIDNCPSCTENVSKTNSFSYKYISIPLHAQYYIQNDRLDIFAIGGFSSNFLTNSKGSYLTASGLVYDLIDVEGTSRSLFNIEIGAGINYNLSYRGSFGLNVIYQNGLNAFSKSPTTSFSGVSIQPGLFYQF